MASIGLALTVTAWIAPAAGQDPDGSEAVVLLIAGGHRFDGERMVPNGGILVRHGKVVALDAGVAGHDTANARFIRLDDDAHVLPGLFDLHAHYAVDLYGEGRDDETVVNPVVFLANGVTSTFPAGEISPDRMRALREAIDAGERTGPRIFNSGPYFGTARPGWDDDAAAADICAEVDEWSAKGARGFKAKGIRTAQLEALIRCAHRHGLTVTGHLDSGFRGSVNPRDAILMGIDRVEHFLGGDDIAGDAPAYSSLVDFGPDSPGFDAIARLYIDQDVFFDATISAYGYFGDQDPRVFTQWTDEMRFLAPDVRDSVESLIAGREPIQQFERIYRVKLRTVKAFYDAGGGHLITLGTDHPSWGAFLSGFGVHRELHAFVLAGIPPAAVLRFATSNAARALGVGDRLGSIGVGKWADLVVVRGDPLADIRNTRKTILVVRAGIPHDPAALLRSVEGRMRQPGR